MFPNIDAERARAGMSKLQLSKALGVSYSTLKSWMSGRTQIPCSKVVEMAILFNVSTDYLLNVKNKTQIKKHTEDKKDERINPYPV